MSYVDMRFLSYFCIFLLWSGGGAYRSLPRKLEFARHWTARRALRGKQGEVVSAPPVDTGSNSLGTAVLTVEQSEAVCAPLVDAGSTSLGTAVRVQAGPGSGKTRVIVHRIEHLLLEEGVAASNVLALTFTRKAADEMRERLGRSEDVTKAGKGVTVSTLHGFSVRVLRRFAELCLPRGGDSFSIYDDDDSRRVVKALLQDYQLPSDISEEDIARFQVAKVCEKISEIKRKGLIDVAGESLAGEERDLPSPPSPDEASVYLRDIDGEREDEDEDEEDEDDEERDALLLTRIVHGLLPGYEAALSSRNALDFDDLILKTYHLLRICKETSSPALIKRIQALFGSSYVSGAGSGGGGEENDEESLARRVWDLGAKVRGRYRHLLVDEWQDIDATQYALIRELCEGVGRPSPAGGAEGSALVDPAARRSLFVVGDADQTIYSWRGADPRTMDEFPADYPQCHTYSLTTNFRSHADIVRSAHSVIGRSKRRRGAAAPGPDGDLLPGAPVKREQQQQEEQEEVGVEVINSYNDAAQARFIAEMASFQLASGNFEPSDVAVLYRKHSQALPIEAALLDGRVPYSLKGGPSFMERKSIKDAMAYLRLLVNPRDQEALRRVINFPRRGLGSKVQTMLFDKMGADLSKFQHEHISWETSDPDWEEDSCEERFSAFRYHESTSVSGVIEAFSAAHASKVALIENVTGKRGGSVKATIVHNEIFSHDFTPDGHSNTTGYITVEYRLTARQASALMDLGAMFKRLRAGLADGIQAGTSAAAAPSPPSLRAFVEAALEETGLLDTSLAADKGPWADLTPKEVEERRKAATYRADLKQLVALVGLHEERYRRQQQAGGDLFSTAGKAESSLAPQLAAFLDGALLDSDLESLLTVDSDGEVVGEAQDRQSVQLMSIHASKGLEFGCVLLVGAEEGTLPSMSGGAIFGKKKKKRVKKGEEDGAGGERYEQELEEERRLLYVGMTRAKRKLMMLYRSRVTMGAATGRKPINVPVQPSRFLGDLPPDVPFKRFS